MNNARPIRIRTDRAAMTSWMSPYVTATPAAPVIPTKNAECRFSGRPRHPKRTEESSTASSAAPGRSSSGSGISVGVLAGGLVEFDIDIFEAFVTLGLSIGDVGASVARGEFDVVGERREQAA